MKLRALLSGHLPPPTGGIATYCQSLLASPLVEMVNLRFVQTSSQRRSIAVAGKATLGNLLAAFLDCRRFFRECLVFRPRVAHICVAPGLSFVKHSVCVVLARSIGVRVILHPHCGIARLYSGPAIWKWYCRKIFRLSTTILALSREWLALRDLLAGTNVHYLPNAIDTRPYLRIAAERSGAPDGTLRLLYLGSLGETKGMFDLLAAFEALDVRPARVVLNLVGDFLTDEDAHRLPARVKAVSSPGKECRLLSPAYGDKKLDLLRETDIFIYPSHYEGMPMALLEAIAAGLPVVATATGGIPDRITDGTNGLLVPVRAPVELGRAIGRLCADAGLRAEFGSRNTRLARSFDIGNYARELAAIYESCVR